MNTIAIAAGAIAVATTAASAQVTAALSDQASVEATLVAPVVEDFDSATVGPLPQDGVSTAFNGFTLAANGTSSFPTDIEIDEDVNDPSDLVLDFFADDTGGFIPSITLTFDSPVDTFAAEFFSPNSSGGLVFNFSDGSSINVADIAGLVFNFSDGSSINVADIAGLDNIGANYIAFTSNTPFTSVDISAAPDDFEFVSIDDVVTGVIPAPGTAALAAFAGLAAARRRR